MEYHLFTQFFELFIGTPTYKLAKFLLKLLAPSTAKQFTVIDLFHFGEKICQQNSNLHMASLDVDSLFANILLEETIDSCADNLYNDNENLPNIPKHYFRNLLNITTKETFFMFNNKYYKQVDGVAMGSPLGPALANILCGVLKVNGFEVVLMILNQCSIDVISMIYLYCFLLLIMQISLGSICHLNIPT